MQLKRVTNGGIVIKYVVTADGGLGGKAPSRRAIFVILQQKGVIFTSFQSHFARFKAVQITKLL